MSFIKEKIVQFFTKNNYKYSEISIKNLISYKINYNNLISIIGFLKASPELRFTILTDLFAIDFPERKERFEINYNLLSLKLNQRILLKIDCPETFSPASISNIFKAANWNEREIFDMFGINFENNPDMRRILTDYGFVGHPLRKDFPLTGFLEVRYDDTLAKIIHEPINLDAEFREFEFTSPWEGNNCILPGDEKAQLKNKD